jgi:glucosamine-6-phosphate deaminase
MNLCPPNPLKSFKVDSLQVYVYQSKQDLAQAAALLTRQILQLAIAQNDAAAAIVATANSQVSFFEKLTLIEDLDWSKISIFHMDEYLGVSAQHPASFRKQVKERLADKVKPKSFHPLQGDAQQALDEIQRYSSLLQTQTIDLCCLGIGENGHIAFNDPPVADFDDPHLVKLVKLDEDCKQQQVGEGHFTSLETVPSYAFTLTIPALCRAQRMLCITPEARKAQAVKTALHGPIATSCPASILRTCPQATLLLDRDSASLL